MSCRLVCVDPTHASQFWPHVTDLIRAAIQRGGLGRFGDVEADVLTGRALVWLAWDGETIKAAAITKLVRGDCDFACIILACGGRNAGEWIGLLDEIEVYAKAEGCDKTRLFGRRGWARLLKHYRSDRIILERSL